MKRHLTKVTDQLNSSFNHAEFNFLHRFVMQELLETENDYVKDLGLVVDVSIYTNTCIHLTALHLYSSVGKTCAGNTCMWYTLKVIKLQIVSIYIHVH